MIRAALDVVSTWAIPVLLAGIPALALARGVKVYPVFVEGAKEGFATAVRIIPALVAIFEALGMLRASGAMDAAAAALAPVTSALGLPASVLPLVLVRPLSGGAALGVVGDVLRSEGPDGYAGRLASVMAGSTETTFYVLAVYMGAAGITRYRQALPAALLADLAGFAAAIVTVRLLLGGP
ncbi:spore maturation protein [Anaeromyxobacter sp. PSR-1]|uniref:spore maturation protein n=1 Tax=Anaeromyxobacter sp. PSR-1 TaxID=1300915 RepID=UPI0005E677DF|nr:nucleoside recognition domain-containing protein [Anaeromyxobacter sp. PSR-1]GAO04815.1 spore maturation protein B [Anaeromyxobacter sp. PSR-1]